MNLGVLSSYHCNYSTYFVEGDIVQVALLLGDHIPSNLEDVVNMRKLYERKINEKSNISLKTMNY